MTIGEPSAPLSRRGGRRPAGGPSSPVALAVAAVLLLLPPSAARAQKPQRPDSSARADSVARRARADSAARRDSAAAAARPGASTAGATAARPPITPRRAFLLSLAVPGLGQTRLGRPNAAALFATVETLALLMASKSALDLRAARYRSGDSIVVAFQLDPTTGAVRRDSLGVPIGATYAPANPLTDRLQSRRTHFEDWIAVLVFNHFFSGADSVVAAQLWDLPGQVSFRPISRGFSLATTFRF